MFRTKITSSGFYVPPRVVTNKDLEKIWDTSDEWIQQRSGIKERRWIEPGETSAGMAAKACQQALERANLKPDDIDLIIFGCLVSDFVFPGTGCLLQKELGFTKHVPALDIRNQCSGFLYGMSIADAFIQSGKYERILLVGSELQSTSLDTKHPEGRNVGVLFGDGAGAAVLEKCDPSEGHLIDTVLHSEGEHAHELGILKPSANDFPRISGEEAPGPTIYPVMNGKLVFKNAVTRMTEVMHEILNKNNMSVQDIDFVIAHQANQRINEMVLKNLEIPENKTHNTLERFGNTTMATIPITFDEAVQLKKIKRGDLVAFVAFGAGFTWGASLFTY